MSVARPLPHDAAALHVTGAARYVDDIPTPRGTLHLAFGLSQIARGRITAMDLAQVRALPGVIAALLLAVSRAIGETMIVVMAAGQRAQITPDPTADLTTITVQIVALLTGDTEFDSPNTLSAFALGFVLFIVTLIFNLIALRVVQRYREKYE